MANEVDYEEEDDLYGDMDTTPTLVKSSSSTINNSFTNSNLQVQSDEKSPSSSSSSSSATNQTQQQFLQITKENKTLKSNIASLYRTAKAEIRRKDRVIERLTLENERLYNDK